jgi:aminomethyltransferase
MTEKNSFSSELLTTPLASWHQEHGARMVEFAGYLMPIQYQSIVQEHLATRQSAGLFDISHMARLRFEGPESTMLLEYLLSRRIDNMQLGQVRYSLICNAEGGILDDVLISYLESPSGRQFYLMVVNAANHQKIINWIQPHLANYTQIELTDVTSATAMLAIQGPNASSIVKRLFPENPERIGKLKYYHSVVTKQMGKPIIVSRTGYTGEDGFELIVRKEDALRVWENLMLAGREFGIQPAGLGARDTLRLEASMPLYGHELHENVDPFTAGLEFAVSLKNRSFIGSSALSTIATRTVEHRRIGLKLSGRRVAREGAEIFAEDQRPVGRVTSGTFSPTLEMPIAMGSVKSEYSAAGTLLKVDIRGLQVDAEVVQMPFYQSSK